MAAVLSASLASGCHWVFPFAGGPSTIDGATQADGSLHAEQRLSLEQGSHGDGPFDADAPLLRDTGAAVERPIFLDAGPTYRDAGWTGCPPADANAALVAPDVMATDLGTLDPSWFAPMAIKYYTVQQGSPATLAVYAGDCADTAAHNYVIIGRVEGGTWHNLDAYACVPPSTSANSPFCCVISLPTDVNSVSIQNLATPGLRVCVYQSTPSPQ